MSCRRFLSAAAVIAVGALVAAPGAIASTDQLSVFEDEPMLLGDAGTRARTLDELRDLGVDVIRTLVYWDHIAPAGTRKPAGFVGGSPAEYPPENWDALDDLVRGASARGMQVLLTPSSPIPAWASGCRHASARVRRTCKPDPRAFGRFVEALGTRYSGGYADENGGGVLPRVSLWSIWNEPNQPGWLTPQYSGRGSRRIVAAAAQYHRLAVSGLAGLRRAGHDGDAKLLAETAPIGREDFASAPAEFIRELFCLDRRGRRMTGLAARLRGCRRYPQLRVTGFAHHPYTRGGSQPPRFKAKDGEITIGTVARLKRLLDAAGRAGRIPRRLPIWYTEHGFQTNPPDRLFGVDLDLQAQYLNESDWIAYRDKRVVSVAQYKLRDEANLASFQTGLRFANGRAKPGLEAYELPLWVSRSGSGAQVYGQLRPAAPGATEQVEIQRQPIGGGDFETVATVVVNSPYGQFLQPVAQNDGVWRLRWLPSDGSPPVFSREARVARR